MRAIALALVCAWSTGCINDDLVACSNGTTCPAGFVCDVAHQGCTTTEQVAACTGLPDDSLCSAPDAVNGACHEGVCLPIACGNGIVDPGEVCDDGNTVSGDGCSADCLSNEACGNGIIDVAKGEQCDDGNARDHDGCSSSCRPETPAWHELAQLGGIAREQQAAAYDVARDRLVMFGGLDNSFSITGRTLEWDGATWTDVTPVLSPAARFGAAAAYDEDHHVVVMFGGSDFGQSFEDTWIWDGTNWTDVTGPMSPSPRDAPSMTYDATRHRVLLFGGLVSPDSLADTWEWDGATWQQLSPASSPPATNTAPMAHDPKRGITVMWAPGGTTWEWDGATWTMVATDGPNPLRGASALAYDPTRGCVVLAGGSSDAWCWDGVSWTELAGAGPSAPYTSLFFDRVRGAIVACGGQASPQPDQLGPDGMWNGVTPDPGPPALESAAMTYDARRGRVVLVGDGIVWESDGGGWVERPTTSPMPSSRNGAALAYDVGRQRVVLWGGDLADPNVWEWDGASWTSIASAVHPIVYTGAALAYDAAIGKVVLFGGDDGTMLHDETWTWDGTTWTDVSGSTRPDPRAESQIAFDAARGEVVLFGGRTPSGNLADTWAWNGADWTQVQPVVSPGPRWDAAMTYDPVRSEVLLYGGSQGGVNGGPMLGDLWRWDGSTWARRTLANAPPMAAGHQLAYDAVHGQTMLYLGQTWTLMWASDRSSDLCGAAVDLDGDGLVGCADPDCWASCTPSCPPQASCALAPTCGDGIADPLETCHSCPQDVTCTPSCGDGYCDPPETAVSCPGDCSP